MNAMNAVEMRGIHKRFGPVNALDGVDFTLEKGEIHAVLGENGAGKTTLMKVLYGMHRADAGEVRVFGKAVSFRSSAQAIACGIGMVHQHFMLVPVLSVADNVTAGQEPRRGIFLDRKAAEDKVRALAESSGFSIDPAARVETLSVGAMQRVEILKALYRGAEILILDEPTAVLTPIEVREFFRALRRLKSQGKSIVIITHKLYEVMEIADRCTILRDGRCVGCVDKAETDIPHLASLMVGRDYDPEGRRPSEHVGGPLWTVSGLSLQRNGIPVLSDISLTVNSGEILGIAGIEGNGQTELIEAVTGLLKPDAMTMTLKGQPVAGTAAERLRTGIGHVPEDRIVRGLSLRRSVEENLILGYEDEEAFSRRGIMDRKAIRRNAEQLIRDYGIKTPDGRTLCGALSGGNQQKVVIARVFSQDPDVVICAQPTRGVDIAASEYIHEVMLKYRDEGRGILLISADLDEIRKLSDRIAVIYKGRIVAVGDADEFDEDRLGLLMTGGGTEAGA